VALGHELKTGYVVLGHELKTDVKLGHETGEWPRNMKMAK
jgi:hypothetical protein